MASTPQTSGFRASVMPTFQGADPRLFNSYGALATGLQSGVDMASRLQEVQLKREQQARLAEQAAYEQTQRAGLEETRRLQNAAAKKALETVVYDGPITYEPQTQAMFGEDGNAMLNPNGTPMLENIAGSNVKVESGRNPVTGVMEYRRTAENPVEAEKRAIDYDLKERAQLNNERDYELRLATYELAKQKGLIEDIPGTNMYRDWTSGKGVMTIYPEGFVRRENPLAAALNAIVNRDNPNGTGTILTNPRVATQSVAVNPLDQPAIDTRFTNIFNQAQPALVQPPPGKTAAEIAAAAKVVADAAKVVAPIIATMAQYNQLPSGTVYQKPGEAFTRKKP